MDVKIENRDIVLSSCGNPVYITSMDELCQRVKIACSVIKGEFPFDRKLGRYPAVIDAKDERAKDKLEMIFKEATFDIPYSDLKVIDVINSDYGITATVEIYCGKKTATTEVTINDKL